MDDEIPLNPTPLVGDVVDTPDGGAEVILPAETEQQATGFSDNLVDVLSDQERLQLSSSLLKAIERDKDARSKRDKQYEDGLRRSGLGDDAPGGAQFSGASRVVHPMLAEACVDFEARAIKELMPAGGPVKVTICGEEDNDKLKIAEIKRDVLNLQLTKLIPGYRDEKESLLSQLPMGGSQYMKLWHDGDTKRAEFVPIDNLYIPFSASNLYSATRLTHAQQINEVEFEARIANGLYEYVDDLGNPQLPDQSASAIANAKIEGKDDSDAYNEDGLRTVYEVYTWQKLQKDSISGGKQAPYIIHLDHHTEKVLGVYRNWEESDAKLKKLDWFVEYGFVPWRGAYKIGLPHLIGGLSGAATGTLRALLDSAHAANAPTLLKLRGSRFVGQTKEVAVTEVMEIEGPANVDDIRKIVSPLPFAGPNPVLFELLGFLVNTGKGVVTTAEEKIADASNSMPVGTSLALIEQGSKVFSAIHQRLHHSQAKELEILCRLNARYPELETWEEHLGKKIDPLIFSNTNDIAPVSDPNIFSEAQRYSQMQAVMQLQTADAGDPTIPWNKVEVRQRMLRLLNVPQPETLLPKQPEPVETDAVQENMAAVAGNQVKAFSTQDHLAHIETHLRFILSPVFGAGPAYSGQQLVPILAHCSEHLTMYYPQMIAQGQAMAAAQGMLDQMSSPDATMAVSAHLADSQAQTMQTVMEMWTAAQQLIQSKMPKPPVDPQVQVAMQVAQMEDARANAKMQVEQRLSVEKAQREGAKQQAEFALASQAQQHEQRMDTIRFDADQKFKAMEQMLTERLSQLDRQVEVMKNEADNHQHQMTELIKNREDNQTQLLIAELRNMGVVPDKQPVKSAVDVERKEEFVDEIEPRGPDHVGTESVMLALISELRDAIAVMSAPNRLVRDHTGKILGVELAQ